MTPPRPGLMERYASGDFLVLVSPPRNDPALFAAAFEAGVDGAKVHLNVEHRASGNRFGSWAEERPAIEEILAAASCPLGVMPGAEVLPSPADFEAMRAAGLDFFDVYAQHQAPFMAALPWTRMLALGHEHSPSDAARLEAQGMHVLEASVVDPAAYGQPLDQADLDAYRALVAATSCPVLVPSQKALVPDDLARLAATGVRSVLLGTLSLGSTPADFRQRLPGFLEARAALAGPGR